MRRHGVLRLAWTAAILTLAAPAAAHDPDWEPDSGDGAESAGRPPPDESAPWPDPFAEERKWKTVVGAGAGYFVPWQGNGGQAVTALLAGESPDGHWRVGGEFLYRSYETRFFDVDDVDVDTYEVNFVLHYLFLPGRVTPYVGFDTGLQVNKIRKTEVQGAPPDFARVDDDLGVGWGFALIAGLEVPLGEQLALYGEVRAGVADQETEEETQFGDKNDHEDLGGATGVLGVRFRF